MSNRGDILSIEPQPPASAVTFAAVNAAMAGANAPVGLNGQQLNGLANPTTAQAAATKAYVDATLAAGAVPFQNAAEITATWDGSVPMYFGWYEGNTAGAVVSFFPVGITGTITRIWIKELTGTVTPGTVTVHLRNTAGVPADVGTPLVLAGGVTSGDQAQALVLVGTEKLVLRIVGAWGGIFVWGFTLEQPASVRVGPFIEISGSLGYIVSAPGQGYNLWRGDGNTYQLGLGDATVVPIAVSPPAAILPAPAIVAAAAWIKGTVTTELQLRIGTRTGIGLITIPVGVYDGTAPSSVFTIVPDAAALPWAMLPDAADVIVAQSKNGGGAFTGILKWTIWVGSQA